MIKKGDLVIVKIPKQSPGALTAVKFFQRLAENVEGKFGIVISASNTSDSDKNRHVVVQFPNIRKVINTRYLEIVDENWHKSSKPNK